MPTHNVQTSWSNGTAVPIAGSTSVTADMEINADLAFAADALNVVNLLSIDVSAVKSFYLYSDQAVLIDTNADTGVNVFTLAAGQAFHWRSGAGTSFVDTAGGAVSTDIVSFRLTQLGGIAGTLKVRVLVDPTP